MNDKHKIIIEIGSFDCCTILIDNIIKKNCFKHKTHHQPHIHQYCIVKAGGKDSFCTDMHMFSVDPIKIKYKNNRS